MKKRNLRSTFLGPSSLAVYCGDLGVRTQILGIESPDLDRSVAAISVDDVGPWLMTSRWRHLGIETRTSECVHGVSARNFHSDVFLFTS